MKKNTMLITALLLSVSVSVSKADEGMWIPLLIEKMNIQHMQENGFKLNAEDIYSINQASMKDAVMIFGGGCTGELISDKGLLITNHHCGRRRIQQHSSVEHDYLTDGFWAMSLKEELTNPGLTVTFLKWMEDVTSKTMEGINPGMTEREREIKIAENILEIENEAIEGTHYSANVEPFFAGNQYFIFVEETFLDVRLVGAPPSAIGNFGGDTDNWMWPRHTGDFSLFRIYAGPDNLPAVYSPENTPYKPAEFFPVSLKGVNPGDFTMVFGYPGSTYEYVHSSHLKMLSQEVNPRLIQIRDKKLEIIKADMETSPEIRIQYTAKAASLSNSWKRWIGEMRGLEKLNALEKKIEFEKGFQDWAIQDPEQKEIYGTLLSDYEKLYSQYSGYYLARSYMNEVFFRSGAELVAFSGRFNDLFEMLDSEDSLEEINQLAGYLKRDVESFFRDYNQSTDEKLFKVLMEMYEQNMDKEFQPSVYINIHSKYNNDFEKYTTSVYNKTVFTRKEELLNFLDSPKTSTARKLMNDPIFLIYQSANRLYVDKVLPEYNRMRTEFSKLDRLYMAGRMKYQPDKVFYSDANSTLRLSYGKVEGYQSRDAVIYKHYTTLEGVIQKDNPEIYDYDVPDQLKKLYKTKDYGRFAEDGQLHVCFIATNHTTGGNSGSPVLNAEGHLIGINFDRAWEGVMSDLMFNPDQCRNISLDIRYALFIIDKFAGAGYLLEEMTIVE